MQFEFIPATAADRDYLLALRKLTMVEHLEQSGQFLTEQEHQARLDVNYHCFFIVRHNDCNVGAIKVLSSDSVIEILQFQMHPSHQSRGYGAAIMRQVIETARPRPVRLTVLKQNPALRLYLRLGFCVMAEDHYEYHLQYQPD